MQSILAAASMLICIFGIAYANMGYSNTSCADAFVTSCYLPSGTTATDAGGTFTSSGTYPYRT